MAPPSNPLQAEFATIDVILRSNAKTRRVDAFALAWIKVEKQLRRLFCYLVFQSSNVSTENRDQWSTVIVENRGLSVSSLTECFDKLSPTTLSAIVGAKYKVLAGHIERIRRYRNKIFHGQNTGKNLSSRQLEDDVEVLRQWVELVASSCDRVIGYDGVSRNTFRRAKTVKKAVVVSYPFTSPIDFKKWLAHVVHRRTGRIAKPSS